MEGAILKICFEDKIKRAFMPTNFMELYEIILKSFPFKDRNFEIYYIDNEKDEILLESEFDYENAIMFMKHQDKKSLKIKIKRCLEESVICDDIREKVIVKPCPYLIKVERTREESVERLHEDDIRIKCPNCARYFIEKSFRKHEKYCQKVFKTKRIPFDSRKQRAINELPEKKFTNLEKELLKYALTTLKIETIDFPSNVEKLLYRPFKQNDLITCNICNRKFIEDSFVKHSKNCLRLKMKRKPFDSKRQRLLSLEHAVLLRKKELINKKSQIFGKMLDINNEKQRWKKLSDRFRQVLKINRMLFKKKVAK
jgi:hypothetical protein